MRNAEAHRHAMEITASYLGSVGAGERNPNHFVPELSRRARGFATWAMIRTLGRGGIANMVARHCRLARYMASKLSEEPGIKVKNDVVLNQLAVRFGPDQPPELGDDLTKKVIERIQSDGICFAGGARWKGQEIMRLSVISWPMTEQDIDVSVAAIIGAWRATQAEAGRTRTGTG